MNPEDAKYWLALKSLEGVGNTLVGPLLERFGSPASVFSAPVHELAGVRGMSRKIAEAILAFSDWDGILRQIDGLNQAGFRVVTFLDECYPKNLLNMYDRPALLYVAGVLNSDDISIAVVGSRHASTYGRYTTDRISRELALRGVTIVSGMARGIDSCAHRGALAAKGRTIAVLGSGLDVIYPPENKKLFDAIVQQGAKLIENVDDILEEILPQLEQPAVKPVSPGRKALETESGPEKPVNDGKIRPAAPEKDEGNLSLADRKILEAIAGGKTHADDIIAQTGFPPAEVMSALIVLELNGRVEQHPGKWFTLKK